MWRGSRRAAKLRRTSSDQLRGVTAMRRMVDLVWSLSTRASGRPRGVLRRYNETIPGRCVTGVFGRSWHLLQSFALSVQPATMSTSEDLLRQYTGEIVPFSFNAGFVCLSFAISLVGTSSTLELIRRRTSHRGIHNL